MIPVDSPCSCRGVASEGMGAAMNTLDSSLRCDVVSALEEQIWLDRREAGGRMVARRAAGFGRILQRLRDLRARMQLGPVDDANGWTGDDPDKRF